MDQTPPKKENILKRPIKFLFRWRPFGLYELICYILMYAGATMFAIGIQQYSPVDVKLIILAIATLYSGFFAALIWNDITDTDIDRIVHPSRPIPDGRISQTRFFAIALVFSALTFLFAVFTSPWCLILVGCTALFVTFHNKYLKKKIKFPAYSEIFTPVQWLTVPLFGFFAVWTALPPTGDINVSVPLLGYLSIHSEQLLPMILIVLFTYFADDAHDLAEGIHDAEGDRKLGVKTYATSFGEKTASRISFAMIFTSGVLGFLLFLFTMFSMISLFLFFIPFILLWLYTLNHSYKLMKTTDSMQRIHEAKIMGKKGYDYLLFTYVLLFITVLIQLLNTWFFHIPTA
jgi:4-hydroxybenzoate polyprenyltransferase